MDIVEPQAVNDLEDRAWCASFVLARQPQYSTPDPLAEMTQLRARLACEVARAVVAHLMPSQTERFAAADQLTAEIAGLDVSAATEFLAGVAAGETGDPS